MTATINANGEIVIPREAGEAAGAREGEEYHVLISTSGRLMLRPRRKRAMTLAAHLRGLSGLTLERRLEGVPDIPKL
jgi:bifunctional DNA-binding transcriptional regulator/antitoxin component of YhaV-PrlF toxin-antitoxin module